MRSPCSSPRPKDARLWVTVEDDDGGRAHADTIEVDGLKEWRSFWSTMPTVHQVDLDTGLIEGAGGSDAHRLSLRVTPALRVASTAFGHHYHDSLYASAGRSGRAAGPADRHVRP